jgi:uracil-DNA glycosylase
MSGAHHREGTWSFDGSLEGLLLLAHRAYCEGAAPEAVANALAVEGELFALLGPAPLRGIAALDCADEAETAGRELRAFSGELFDMILRVWMSEEALELPLLRLCALAGLHGTELLADHGRPEVRAIVRCSRRVSGEIHKLTGLARFSPVAGLYSAALEPDANIIAALLPHFARRFGDGDFALVDLRRQLALARRGGSYETATGEEVLALVPPLEGDGEVLLWKRYFEATDNPARRNPELQRRLMPRRYWRFLPELSG